MNQDKEIKNNRSYKIEDSIYNEVEKLIKKNTGLAVSTYIRMFLVEYLNKNKKNSLQRL